MNSNKNLIFTQLKHQLIPNLGVSYMDLSLSSSSKNTQQSGKTIPKQKERKIRTHRRTRKTPLLDAEMVIKGKQNIQKNHLSFLTLTAKDSKIHLSFLTLVFSTGGFPAQAAQLLRQNKERKLHFHTNQTN